MLYASSLLMKAKPHVAVVGAGAFGGWTALQLLERGTRVTLVDAWGPGNSRASSGGETRIMRGAYGPDQPYTEIAARALKLWEKYERRWKRQFLHRCGVLWMASAPDDSFERGSLNTLREAKIPFRELSVAQMKKRWPQINFDGITWAIFEPQSGYLDARASCQMVANTFVAKGGRYRQTSVLPDGLESEDESKHGVRLCDGSRLTADQYVFACGPWLGRLFPDAIGSLVQATKQQVFFFGAPAGDDRFSERHLPVWGDHRGKFYYGIPGSGRRGFKIADDTRGTEFDPTSGERVADPEILQEIRQYVAFRFPALRNAPLVESRVCQYEQTPDSHFIIDRHPDNPNMWLLGGGSGHGFKHGPAIGEMMAELVLRDQTPDATWRLARFQEA